MTIRTVLVDLGGTLVDFFGHTSPSEISPHSLAMATQALIERGYDVPPPDVQERRWQAERQDPNDPLVKPLEDRLSRVFGIDPKDAMALQSACRAFMRPLFAQARMFEDTLPFLHHVRRRDMKAIIVSNTTWGSPALLWREVLERMGMADHIVGAVFCRDIGWRKPHPRIYSHALEMAMTSAQECLFVGDNPVWDVEGPTAAGISSVLLDRRMEWVDQGYDRATSLMEVMDHCLR